MRRSNGTARVSRAGQKGLKQVDYRLTTDRARSLQAPSALDTGSLMPTRNEGAINRSVKANAARVIACVPWASPLPPFHVVLKADHELARVLERGSPFTVFWVITQHICEESARVPSNHKDSAVYVLNVVRKGFQISRKPGPVCPLAKNPGTIRGICSSYIAESPPCVLTTTKHRLSRRIQRFVLHSSRQIPC